MAMCQHIIPLGWHYKVQFLHTIYLDIYLSAYFASRREGPL
jgi:hypothetical protein